MMMQKQGLYSPEYEHDACGIGFVVNIHGKRTHQTVKDGLKILANLAHRGGEGSDENTGDGAGMLLQIPDAFFRKVCPEENITLPQADDYGVGMVFLPRQSDAREKCMKVIDKAVEEEGQIVLGWRDTPVNESTIGATAEENRPYIMQVFIGRGEKTKKGMPFDRALYVIRKKLEKRTIELTETDPRYFYFASLSTRTIVYKGMLTPEQMDAFYLDLKDLSFDSALALVHSRYSTNTFPSWERAHPYRYLIHNGEINTLRGNINAMYARSASISNKAFGDDMEKVLPIINPNGSDDNVKVANENGHGGGLGPVYAGYSCGSCHRNAGRTEPTYWTSFKQGSNDGSGPYGFTSSLIYITRKNGTFFPNYGRVIHDQAIYGVRPEGKLKVRIDSMEFSFPDGEKYTLCKPQWTVTEWYTDSVKPEDLFCTVRVPLRHVGMGQIMALDQDEIEALARKSNYPEWGISGRCNYINERGKLRLGLSGNKAHHADLTVELGFSSDMGMTNSRYPEEICEGQIQMEEGSMMGLSYDMLDVSTEDMEDVDLYMQGLAVPARRNVNDADVKAGEQLFYEAGCHLCHVTTLHTKTRGSVLLAGTALPWLGGQTIHPYSDFLLHDMGSEIMGVGLNDNFVSGLARGNEWRTTPLWGVGLQKKVNGHTYFLHDGRARNFVEAIMWHGGEGEASKNKFKNMSKKERDQLVQFLWSL